jgi:hypothetical protein
MPAEAYMARNSSHAIGRWYQGPVERTVVTQCLSVLVSQPHGRNGTRRKGQPTSAARCVAALLVACPNRNRCPVSASPRRHTRPSFNGAFEIAQQTARATAMLRAASPSNLRSGRDPCRETSIAASPCGFPSAVRQMRSRPARLSGESLVLRAPHAEVASGWTTEHHSAERRRGRVIRCHARNARI